MSRDLKIALAFATVVVGIGLALLRGDGNADLVTATRVRPQSEVPHDAAPLTLRQKLEALHGDIEVRPDQEGTWRDFADAMTELDRLTRAYERRLASGENVDENSERLRHALIYGDAMNKIDDGLSQRQAIVVHGLAGQLAASALCRKLTAR